MDPQQNEQPVEPQRPRIETPKSKDPVCGMEVEGGRAKGGSSSFGGQSYDFCSDECRQKFEDNPGAYTAPH
ncbi:MAG: YHS domain-containing protein [Archangiaceae bacterium]|nr:YHS domain-containing protein [Archangiaceae bacterium]